MPPLSLALLVALLAVVDQSQIRLRVAPPPQQEAALVPSDSLTTWNPGLSIPTDLTQCGSTILASTYGDGAQEASAGIGHEPVGLAEMAACYLPLLERHRSNILMVGVFCAHHPGSYDPNNHGGGRGVLELGEPYIGGVRWLTGYLHRW